MDNHLISEFEKYFKSWSGYTVPFKPLETIEKEDALKLDAYYVGKYSNAMLIRFEKYYKNKLEWIDEYTYHENRKLKSRKMTKKDGTVTFQEFDKKGKIIR